MGRSLVVALLAVAGMGVAAYVVSRDSVAVPVTHLRSPQKLAPPTARAKPKVTPKRTTTTHTTTTTPTIPTTTVDDHGGNRGPGGGGDDSSGRGGGGHGGDD
jgi:hypothetical protein